MSAPSASTAAARRRRTSAGAWRPVAAAIVLVGTILLISRPPSDVRSAAHTVPMEWMESAVATDGAAEAAVTKALRAEATANARAEYLQSRLLRLQQQQQRARVISAHAATTRRVEPGAADRLIQICRGLAPAVAVRPAPSKSLTSRLVAELSPWQWAASAARLRFNPEDIEGALSTPWGEGRWGALPREPGLLWADFASRSHVLWVHGCTLQSFRCTDNETVAVHARGDAAIAGAPAVVAALAGPQVVASLAASCKGPSSGQPTGVGQAGASLKIPTAGGRPSCLRAVRRSAWVWAGRHLAAEGHGAALAEPGRGVGLAPDRSLALALGRPGGGGAREWGTACITATAFEAERRRGDAGRAWEAGRKDSGRGSEGGNQCTLLAWECVHAAAGSGSGYEVLALKRPPPREDGVGTRDAGDRNGSSMALLTLVQLDEEGLVVQGCPSGEPRARLASAAQGTPPSTVGQEHVTGAWVGDASSYCGVQLATSWHGHHDGHVWTSSGGAVEEEEDEEGDADDE